ncbi:hypothetical protein [Actinokineospora terrae]|uniref:Uncharacterized protein n=1 Tax=Actinokineospora terrae TaxID=155974 RepID=A0A1H9T6K6_9PSEU|nr:hypothetical protein [Actinokineospora terrae]SER92213.1 hypothetical protein SAMN04487818_10675 [Actinokineospora terrae]
MPPTDTVAVAAYPELQHLIDVRDAGWVFSPTLDDDGVTQIYGFRHWPGGWIDLLVIHHSTNTAAARATHDGGLVWNRTGTLVDVIDQLVDLPDPHDPLAPRLVIGRVPTLWTP